MTQTVYLHVGCPKSGTTYLQRALDTNRDALAKAGVLVVGESQGDRVHAGLQVRQDPRLESMPVGRRRMWDQLVAQIRGWDGSAAVLSYELLSAATAEQAAAALRDLSGFDVHLVITARDLGRAIPSAWQEQLKFGMTEPLQSWLPPSGASGRIEWGWRTMDPSAVARRWGKELAPDHVHIVTVPATRSDETELWRRFADACGVGAVVVQAHPERTNESLGVVQAELLRRLNTRLGPPIEGSREKARWWRDTLAHRVLAAHRSDPVGITDEQLQVATDRSAKAIAAITAAGYEVHGDLADLSATRGGGRAPGDVSPDELLDAAGDTVLGLVRLLREASTQEPAGTTSARTLVGHAARRLTAPYVGRRQRELADRIAELEAQISEARALHLRVASLGDVVAELLLPVDLQDGAVTRQALREYRKESL